MLLARRFGAEVVSVDSMQVFRGMDIGTAKPTAAERDVVRHHMLDIADPADSFSVAQFQGLGRDVMRQGDEAGTRLLIVGGSGLHFRALVDPLEFAPSDPDRRHQLERVAAAEARDRLLMADPDAGAWVALDNARRVTRALEVMELTGETPSQRAARPSAAAVRGYQSLWPVVALGIDPGPLLADRIRTRFGAMLDSGLVAEVARLAPVMGPVASQAVGYRDLLAVARGECDLAQGTRRAVAATTALARRQRTFHRRDPRIRWLRWDDDPNVVAGEAAQLLEEEAGWTS